MSTSPQAAARCPHLGPLALALPLSLAGAGAWAQDAAVPRHGVLVPTFSAEESLVDLRDRPGGGNGLGSLTRVSPGVHYDTRSGRVQGSLDYSANLIYRSGRGNPSDTELQNALGAHFVAEAITNRAFIEAQATVSQQTISAFGQQTLDGDLLQNSNRTEVLTASVTPSLRGQFGELAQYDMRVSAGGTLTKNSPADSQYSSASVQLGSIGSNSMLGWTLSGTQQRVNFRGPARSLNERLAVGVVLRPLPDLQLSASGGREVEDSAGVEKVYQTNYGAGLKWMPNPRTRFEVDTEKRYFGNSGHLTIEHRLPRTAWTYNFTRDATTGSSAGGVGQPLTRFDQLYALEASLQPDPDLRRVQVLDELRAAGLNPNDMVVGGFLTSVLSLQQRQDLSVTLRGLRGSISLQAFASQLRTLSTGGGADPLGGDAVHQLGYTGTLTYRLTPLSTVNVLGSRLMTLDTPTRPGSDLKSASISLTSQIGRRTSTQLGARYAVFHSQTDPYHEASLTGSLSLRF
jgi:uncharacterized protein (PEP-CTERM system associated)